jgi:hypothetical protein
MFLYFKIKQGKFLLSTMLGDIQELNESLYDSVLILQKLSGCAVKLAVYDGVCNLVHVVADLGHVGKVDDCKLYTLSTIFYQLVCSILICRVECML